MGELRFTVPGAPRGKGRPRFFRRGPGVGTYADAKTAAYENLVALAASQAHRGEAPLDGPLAVSLLFVLPRPKSAPKRVVLPATKPDLDNLTKAILDGCNQAGVWADDARVVLLTARKVYGEPRCEVEIATAAACLWSGAGRELVRLHGAAARVHTPEASAAENGLAGRPRIEDRGPGQAPGPLK